MKHLSLAEAKNFRRRLLTLLSGIAPPSRGCQSVGTTARLLIMNGCFIEAVGEDHLGSTRGGRQAKTDGRDANGRSGSAARWPRSPKHLQRPSDRASVLMHIGVTLPSAHALNMQGQALRVEPRWMLLVELGLRP